MNPDHLLLGTKADNNRDMCAKGRHVPGGTYQAGNYARGEAHHAAKLTQDTVRSIRADRAAGASYGVLGRKYGLSSGHLFRIVNRQAWRHVE